MRLVLIADTFPPLKSSGAIQIRDLSREFVRQGHELTVLLPSSVIKQPFIVENVDGVELIRLRSPRIKDLNYLRRTINEFITPFMMYLNLRKSRVDLQKLDAVLWYSPSIFLAPLANFLKKKNNVKGYLIIRDIFPDWAVDMGLIQKNSIVHSILSLVANYQYSVADYIGVQSKGNLVYFEGSGRHSRQKIEVLNNWLGSRTFSQKYINLKETKFAKRKVFIYAGNMGIAQGLNIFIDLACHLKQRKDLGFLFVGRGSEFAQLKKRSDDKKLENLLFYDEIDPDEIGGLYKQCIAGIVSLDLRHKSHNIPGKFLSYMQYGLPVLACINKGNDLSELIKYENIGQVCESNCIKELIDVTEKLIRQIEEDEGISKRCIAFFEKEFTVENTVKQICSSITS
jgi:glycosyltransferase involved in cell wall biosynthesis